MLNLSVLVPIVLPLSVPLPLPAPLYPPGAVTVFDAASVKSPPPAISPPIVSLFVLGLYATPASVFIVSFAAEAFALSTNVR